MVSNNFWMEIVLHYLFQPHLFHLNKMVFELLIVDINFSIDLGPISENLKF